MSTKSGKKIALLSMSAALLSPAAFAQEAQPPAEEIVVVGTYLRNSNFSAGSPTALLSADKLDALGVTDIGDIARFEPALSASPINSSATAAGSLGAARMEIRNLPTLVLLNGRRQVASGTSSAAADINSLVPQIALGRVEVLKGGASSLYGSDAIGGVVNFVTRSDLNGVEVTGDYSKTSASDQEQWSTAVAAGGDVAGFKVLAAGSYFSRDRLDGLERPFSRAVADFPIAFPPTLVNPVNGRTFADPTCGTVPYTRVVTTAPNGSTQCFIQNAPYQGLMPSTVRTQAYASATRDLSPNVKLSIETAYSYTDSVQTAPPTLPKANTTQAITILRTNPFNPLAAQITTPAMVYLGFPFLQQGPDRDLRASAEVWRVSTGLEASISGWDVDAYVTTSQSLYQRHRPETSRIAFQAAIASGAFNPFGSAFFATPGTAAFNTPEDYALFSVDSSLHALQTQWAFDGIARGELFELPAGPVDIAFGVQVRDEAFKKSIDQLSRTGGLLFTAIDSDARITRGSTGVFVEAGVPLAQTLDLQVAVRYQSYEGGAESTDPRIGLIWRAAPWLSLRGSYATVFRAPELVQFGGSTLGSAVVDDPTTAAVERINLSTQIVGSPALQPEAAKTYQFGAVSTFGTLKLSIDYFNYDYTDQIVPERAQDVINAAPTSARVLRNTTGTITGISPLTFLNAASTTLSGVDVSAQTTFDFGKVGALDLTLAGTVVTDFSETGGIGRAATSAYGAPETTVQGSATWRQGPFAIGGVVRHYGSYKEESVSFGDQTIADVQASLDTPKVAGTQGRVSVGVKNVFDELPQFNPLVTEGYDVSSPYDPRGRILYVSFKTKL